MKQKDLLTILKAIGGTNIEEAFNLAFKNYQESSLATLYCFSDRWQTNHWRNE